MGIADEVLLVLMPGSGDSVQALKAGIMEIPDVIAVNKMDQPGAKAMLNDIRGVIALDPDATRAAADRAHRGGARGGCRAALGRARRAPAMRSRRPASSSERRRRNLAGEVVAAATARAPGPHRARDRGGRRRSGSSIAAVQRREVDPLTAADADRRRRSLRGGAAVTRPALADLVAARSRLDGISRVTPVLSSSTLERLAGRVVSLEGREPPADRRLQDPGRLQHDRAADRSASGGRASSTASAGNHGQAVAWAARRAGIAATIFVPEGAPMAKVDAARGYGATVALGGRRLRRGGRGGTCPRRGDGCDLRPRVRRPAGDRGAGHARPRARRAASGRAGHRRDPRSAAAASRRASRSRCARCGRSSRSSASRPPPCAPFAGLAPTGPTIADGIAVKYPAELTSAILRDLLDEVVVVDDEAISQAIVLLLERSKLVVEGAGAAPVAAAARGGSCRATDRSAPCSREATSTRRR